MSPRHTHRRRLLLTVAVLCAALLSAGTAMADSDDWATVGAGARLAYQEPGMTDASGQDYMLALGLRGELLYAFGAEIEYVPLSDRLESDIYRSSLRLTAHLHLVNSRYFDFHLGVGLASDSLGDLVNLEGASTLYRLGAGTEIVLGGHWAIGIDGYWNLPGLGYYNQRLTASLQDGGEVANPREQIDPSQIEFGFALRYYL
jgi:hypothetical protein